jgi:hypothetical protein
MNLNSNFSPGRTIAVIGFALMLVYAQSANASHKIDHRYTVWGEIKYEDDAPAADLVVQLMVKDGEPIGEVKTDYRGRFRVVLHVHNQDVYKVFDMRINNVTRKVRILFSPNDRQSERGQRVDLVVKREGESDTPAIQVQ